MATGTVTIPIAGFFTVVVNDCSTEKEAIEKGIDKVNNLLSNMAVCGRSVEGYDDIREWEWNAYHKLIEGNCNYVNVTEAECDEFDEEFEND